MNDYQFFQRQYRRAQIVCGALCLVIATGGCCACLLLALAYGGG